jgi:predicted nucleotidyltransferase
MMNLTHIENILKQQESELKKQYKLKRIGIFGSYRRKGQNKKSDLDILVEFKEAPGLLKFMEIEGYLSRITGLKVDLVMKNALKPLLRKYILKEVMYIW